jgi:hypothetical protein
MPGSHGWGSVGADLADELGHGDSGWCRGRAPHKMGLHFPDEVVLLRMLFCWAPLRHRCVWQRCACAAVGMYGCVCACLCFQCAFICACRGCAQHPPHSLESVDATLLSNLGSATVGLEANPRNHQSMEERVAQRSCWTCAGQRPTTIDPPQVQATLSPEMHVGRRVVQHRLLFMSTPSWLMSL